MQFIIRILIFIVLFTIVEYYFLRKLIGSVKILFPKIFQFNIKTIVTIAILILNIYPVFLIIDWSYSQITGAPVWIPQNDFFDWFIIYPFWTYIFLAVQCILFFLIIECVKLFLLPFFRKNIQRIKYLESWSVVALIIGFGIYIPSRVIYDYYSVEVRSVTYKNANLPDGLNNLKFALISDIHADRYTYEKRLGNYISKINESNPDLVLIGGDFISFTSDYIKFAAAKVGEIKSRYGIYSCVGDHDNWAYRDDTQRSLAEVAGELKKHKIFMFDNENERLIVNNVPILITFATDTYVRKIPQVELNKLLSDTNKYGLKIFLTHQPGSYLINTAEKHKYDLFLAGHTHGGQITFLFPFINLTPTLLETKFVKGNFNIGKMLIVVTRGLGMSLVPMRYNSTPEITIINITR